MPIDPVPRPRSPLRVAVMTFGAIVLVGTLISLAVLGRHGLMNEDASAHGRWVGERLGGLGLIGAAIAYLVQRRQLRRG